MRPQVDITVLERRVSTCTSAKSAKALGTAWDRLRFWAKVRVTDNRDGCWLWVGSRTSNGRYGQFMWASVYGHSRPVGAHRACWEMENGPLGTDQHVCHSCDTPLCVNPRHLFAGTHADNMQDASIKGRLSVPRPGRRKLSDEQVQEVIALCRNGHTQLSVAHQFGVSKGFVSLLLSGKRRQRPAMRRSA